MLAIDVERQRRLADAELDRTHEAFQHAETLLDLLAQSPGAIELEQDTPQRRNEEIGQRLLLVRLDGADLVASLLGKLAHARQ